MKRVKIAYLEDDGEQAKLIELWLTQAGNKVSHYASGRDFIDSVLAQPFDLLILDWELPDINGPEVLAVIRSKLDWTSKSSKL